MNGDNICILDNGAYMAKVGLSANDEPKIVPNCIMKAKSERRRAFIGNQIEECRDASGLFYILCFQKGYLLNWDIQKTVWDHIFSPECAFSLNEKILVVTEPQFNFISIQEAMTEIFFEEYECDALYRTTAADLSAYHYAYDKNILDEGATCIIIDIGYSFTHIVPFLRGKRYKLGIRRIDIGGKVLTNHLKELISYRHLNVMDESYVVNQIKEDICYVSQNFKDDMSNSMKKSDENPIIQEYVLPDFSTVKRGYVKKKNDPTPEQQTIKLNNERFTIPELLFHPSDVGIDQMGIPEAVLDCIESCPVSARHILLSNIVVCGGSSQFSGIKERLHTEIRALAADDMDVNVILVKNPVTYAWEGGKYLSRIENFRANTVTKEEYDEYGTSASIEKCVI